MLTYNERDLKLFSYDDALLTLLKRTSRHSLFNMLNKWFDSTQLRPVRPESTIADYDTTPRLSKTDIIKRMTTIDWPQGLYACQIAQLQFERITGLKRLFWRAIRITSDEEHLRLDYEMDEIATAMEAYMKEFFYCYVYSFQHPENDTHIYVLCVSPENDGEITVSSLVYSYMISFPETEYVVTPKYVWTVDLDGYFKEALLTAYSANKLLIETAYVESIAELKNKIDNRNSKGILGLLRKNALDGTPLDIRQKRPREFDKYYVNEGEQRKRIVPIDMEEMKARYEALEENFGWDEVEGSRSLEVDLELPLNTGNENSLLYYEDDIVEISMLIEGSNVAEGVRKSIISGKIDTPAPLWLEAIAVSDYKKIKVHPDGVVENREAKPDSEEQQASSED